MKMMLSTCAAIVQGKLIGKDVAITGVSIDTRVIKAEQLYVAIKGHNFDGNDFVDQAEKAGAIAAIVHAGAGVSSALPHIVVDDTRLALARLAGAWRLFLSENEKPLSVVGVTGSNGKTTVKEMVAAILAVKDTVLFTQGNLNNDIGVPLTLFRLTEQDRYAVIEMGANHIGEIAYTSHYANADVVIITNAGAAHLEGFGSLSGVAKGKGEIIETLGDKGVAVLNREDVYFDYWKSVAGNRKVISFGLGADADVTAKVIEMGINNNSFISAFNLVTAQGTVEVNLKLAGQHNVLNALAATAATLALGIELEQVKAGLETINPVVGRMQPLVGCLGNIIIDDTYNANADSLEAGLEVLNQLKGRHWLVFGAFSELGAQSAKIHEEIAEVIKSSGVTRIFAVGADARNTVQAFGLGATFYEKQEDLIAELKQELRGDEVILIKGSRAQHMENVAAALVENFRN
jgi:UDP-N-acetylmuramoyl-tripeptide--D-alanyl-D-alanine ligase